MNFFGLHVQDVNYYPEEKAIREGPEGVKWELGFAYFCTGKMRSGSLRLGITNTKLGMGNMSLHNICK